MASYGQPAQPQQYGQPYASQPPQQSYATPPQQQPYQQPYAGPPAQQLQYGAPAQPGPGPAPQYSSYAVSVMDRSSGNLQYERVLKIKQLLAHAKSTALVDGFPVRPARIAQVL